MKFKDSADDALLLAGEVVDVTEKGLSARGSSAWHLRRELKKKINGNVLWPQLHSACPNVQRQRLVQYEWMIRRELHFSVIFAVGRDRAIREHVSTDEAQSRPRTQLSLCRCDLRALLAVLMSLLIAGAKGTRMTRRACPS